MMGIKTLSLSLQNSFGSVEGSLLKNEEISFKKFPTQKSHQRTSSLMATCL